MPYTAPDIKDQSVQYPNRFAITGVAGNVYEVVPSFGAVTEAGTEVNKALLQPIADAMQALDAKVDRFVQLLSFTTTTNTTQVNLDVSGIDFSEYVNIWLYAREFNRASSTGAVVAAVRFNNISTANYSHSLYTITSGAITSSASQTSVDAVTYTELGEFGFDLQIRPSRIYINYLIYPQTTSASTRIEGLLNTTAIPLTSINIIASVANQLKAGAKFFLYGVVK